MIKQKIVITVPRMDEKSRAEAMKTAVVFQGVRSIAVEGNDNNQLVVVGVGVDTARMTTRLKELMGSAVITSLNEVEASGQKKEEKKEEKKEGKAESKMEAICPPCPGLPSQILVQECPCYERDPYCSIL